MQNENNGYNFTLYLFKKVLITFHDGHCISGMLTPSALPEQITVDNETYPIDSIADIEMTGKLTYRAEETDSDKTCEIGNLFFGLDDFVVGTDHSKIIYDEFDHTAACHLVFEDSRISVRDVRLLSSAHRLYMPVLTNAPYLYLLCDGTKVVGILQNDDDLSIRCADGTTVPVSANDIVDVMRLPLTNECVEITLGDGAKISGTVSGTSDSMLVLMGEAAYSVNLSNITSIRYKGVISTGIIGSKRQIKVSLGVKEEAFLCKAFSDAAQPDWGFLDDGTEATFIPGVTDSGLIAKEVTVEDMDLDDEDEEYRTGIVIIFPTPTRPFGYIGEEYITKTYSMVTLQEMPRGTICFSQDQIDPSFDPATLYNNIHIVKYLPSKSGDPIRARRLIWERRYPLSEYARVWIDENGNVNTLPVSVLFLEKFLHQNIEMTANNGEQFTGKLIATTNVAITMETTEGEVSVNKDEIHHVYYSGTVTAYRPNNGTGFINGQYWFHVNNFINRDEIGSLEIGSSVRFTFEVSTKGTMNAATNIELTGVSTERGYLLKYVPPGVGRRDCGFIVSPALLQERLDSRRGDIYVDGKDITNIDSFQLDTNRYYYAVSYTPGENGKAYGVKILKEYLRGQAPEEVAPVKQPAPVQSVKTHVETKLLSDVVSPTIAFGDAEYEYGLISMYTTQYALINPLYYNRSYTTDGTYDLARSVLFFPKEATVLPTDRLKTGKSAYLVRYVKKGVIAHPATGAEQPTIDYSYPVEVVCTFPKKMYASIHLDGEQILFEYVDDMHMEMGNFSKSNEEHDDDAPELMVGESVYLKLKDSSVCLGRFVAEEATAYVVSNGTNAETKVQKDDVFRFFRFGVITALNLENGTATVNNSFDFGLDVAEPKMVSILKAQKNFVRLHVMYSCADGKVTEVCRISKRCYGCLPWETGNVSVVERTPPSISIQLNNEAAGEVATLFLTVLSDGVNTYVNNRTIEGRSVFVKWVRHPFLREDSAEPELATMAVEVRCQEEELKIQYDEGKDVYFGYRNETVGFPVFGNSKFLQERIGETVLVMFRASADMVNLEGFLADDMDDAEENTELTEEEKSKGLLKESLSLLLVQKNTEQLPHGKFAMDEDGRLLEPQQAIDFFLSKSQHLPAIKLALAYPDCKVPRGRLLLSELKSRCTRIGADENFHYGEHVYYLLTLLRHPEKLRDENGKHRRGYKYRYSDYNCLYSIFAQDFEDRQQVLAVNQSGRSMSGADLEMLFAKQCPRVSGLVAHLMFLDASNTSKVVPMIRRNKQLCSDIVAYARRIDERITSEDVDEVIQALQDWYRRDKNRFTERLIALIGASDVCGALKEPLMHMQSRFLKLICDEDEARFERLLKICMDVLDYTNLPGFSQQELVLQGAYRDICALEEEIVVHPCKESVEILLSSGRVDVENNILVAVKKHILALLNRLYQAASNPRITCTVNQQSIRPEERSFWLLIENGHASENLQPAENLRIELEPFTLGFLPQAQVVLPRNRIACGERLAVEVRFELSGDVSDAVEFGWTAFYECTTELQDNGNTKRSEVSQESDEPLQFLMNATTDVKTVGMENPYRGAAIGHPLVDKKMFFGRKKEKDEIFRCICTEDRQHFRAGSAVILYGQKKSGKTSLVNQIKNDIKENTVLSDKAIFVDFQNILDEIGGVEQLPCFKRAFYSVIMSRFQDEVFDNHPSVVEQMEQVGLEIPDLLSPDSRDVWSAQFDKFFRDFAKMDGGKHHLILFMDEFTVLSTTILELIQSDPSKESLKNIPNFIKTFSQYGFIQVIIGHEAMVRALDKLTVFNHTVEFAKTIEISTLDEAAAKELVKKPMRDAFGYDVYNSKLGEQAVERLLDLSGCHPTFLMRLCNKTFDYYTDSQKCPRTQLILDDINAMMREFIGELLLDDFESLLLEDGDEVDVTEKRSTYRYLTCAALLSLTSYDKRTADSSEIAQKLARDFGYSSEQIDETRGLLEARRVISITNGGRVKINTGLFVEYVWQKNGLK